MAFQHQLQAVFLVDAGGARIVVDGDDIGLGILLPQGADGALAGDVVGQAAEGLHAHDVGHAGIDQLAHLRREQPALAHPRKSALSQKAIDNAVVVVEDFNFDAPSTKAFIEVLNNLKVSERKQLFVLPSSNKAVYLSARNLKGTQMAIASDINTYGIMNAEVLVVTESSLEIINNTLTNTKEA